MREETTQEVTRGAVEDAVITIDATDTIEEFDSNAVKMFGVPRANAVGKRLSDLFIPPRLRSVHRQAVARQSHQQKPDRLGRHHEGIAMRGDGTEFPVDIAITRSETADRLLFTGVIRDLSDEKRAESRAETENRERQLILDSVGEGICGTDEEGIIIFSNPSAADQLGWNAEELVGQSLFDIVLPAATGGIHPKEGCPIYSVLKKGGVRHVREALFARKDGTVLSVEYTVTSLRERDDKTRGMVLAFREIDIRTKANGIQRLLSSVIEQIGEAVVITDAWGCVQYVNAAFERITGYSRGDALGLDWWKLRIKGGQDKACAEMRKHLAAGQTWEGKSTNHRKDGTVYNEELMASPVRNEAGRVAHHVLLIRDVTEKNELEQQLLQSQKMEALGQMAGGVAHDFNNLLTAILGYCSAAMDRVADDSSTYEDLKQVVLAGERAARMTRKLLALGRKNMAVSEPADLNGLITDMEPFLRRTLTSDVELEIDLGASDQMVLLDKSSLEQVILNLVVNARDAMTSGGHLQVKTDRIVIKEENRNGFADVTPGSYMLLSVRDDGCGMTEKIQTRIFEPFFTTKEKDKGTGLGLSTVYSIIRQGGGFVSAKSDIGVGTTFELLLPLADGEDNGLKIRESVQETRGTETILLTEDEVAVRALCARTLTSRGYHVLQASNGAEALSMYQASEGKINMVITDMTMPTMGGKDLVEQLRRIKPDLHVLFMTGFTEDVACNHATGRKYPMLLKPFTQQALVERVRGILGRDAETYEESAPARRPAE